MEIEELEDENSLVNSENAISNRVSNSGCNDRELEFAPDDFNTHENEIA